MFSLKTEKNRYFHGSTLTKLFVMSKRGFTLIELLVTIAIIGILSSVILVSLSSAQIKSRDAKRIAEVRQIQSALEMYYTSYGRYPVSGGCGATFPNSGWINSVECLSDGRWFRNGATNYLSEFIPSDPVDPINQINSWRGVYSYYSQGYNNQWYMLVFALEKYPNPSLESTDGVMGYHYGSGSNGIITVGVSK